MRKQLQAYIANPMFIRYVVTGSLTVTIDIGLLTLLRELFHLNVYLAATISFWTSLFFNFLVNKLWTFQTADNTSYHVILYALLIAANYTTGLIAIAVFAKFHIGYTIAKVCALTLTTTWNYFLYKEVVFVKPDKRVAFAAVSADQLNARG